MFKSLLLFVFLIFARFANSQTNTNRSLPDINVFALDNDAFEAGKITIKLFRNQQLKFKIIVKNGKLQSNHLGLNNIINQFYFKNSSSLFKNILQDESSSLKHQQWNLDLWFTINFDEQQSVKKLYTALQNTHLFEVVEPVYKKHLLGLNYVPNDLKLPDQWHYNNTGQGGGKIGKDIKLFSAWDIETGNPNVLVALHDMGIQLDHPDLAQNIAVGKNFNFIDNNNTIVPGYHGTQTAGTIAAVNNNGIGVCGIAGGDGTVNSGIRIMSMQIFKGNSSGGFAESFIHAADNGAAISSNSWAYDIENVYEIAVLDAIDYFIETAGGSALQGGLVIFASGNVSRAIKYYPSAYDRVICVAATNNKDTKANYSTFGSWVDIAAPGGDYSAATASQVISTTINGGYAGDHGTSMSCPHVAGVAALIVSKLLGKASASDIREILLSTTDNIDSLNPLFIGLLGTGRLNAFKALTKAQKIFNGQNVAAPDSFKAMNNCNSIVLSWKKNITNNDVIVIQSNINEIGSLVNGSIYNIGDKLLGLGQIIYKGNATNFTLPSNNSYLNYFKIFSIDASNNYSLGKDATIVANVYLNASGSTIQNFDFPPYFPTKEWNIINPNKDITWTHTVVDTANTGAGDLYSMCMYNYNLNKTLGSIDLLTSPIINTSNTDAVSLAFWYAYKFRNTGFAINDTLEVLVSTNCGNSYTSIWKKGGLNLATVSNTGDTAFYPFGLDKWKKINIDLSNLKNNNNLMVAFKCINGKGNNLFLDNINIDVRFKNDVELVKIISPQNSSCNQQITPQILFTNKGNNTINSLDIKYRIDNGTVVSTTWAGALKKDDTTTISLKNIAVTNGNHSIKIYSNLPNNSSDDYILNDTALGNFFITNSSTLPIMEGFEGGIFPPKNWFILQNTNSNITWSKDLEVGNNSGSSAVIQNFLYDASGNKDDLITPVFGIDKNMDSAFLLFDYAHATRILPVTKADFDTLEIGISKDCGSSWNTIWKKGGNDLLTTNSLFPYKAFSPQLNDWKSDSIFITDKLNAGDNVQLRFRNTTYWGNNIYLDNIKFYTKFYAAGIKQKGYAIYPNPVKNNLFLQHLNPPTNLKQIRLVNSIGSIIFIKNYSAIASKDLIINTSNLAIDVYVLQLIYADKIITEKIVKLHP